MRGKRITRWRLQLNRRSMTRLLITIGVVCALATGPIVMARTIDAPQAAGKKSKTADMPEKKFVRGPSLRPKTEFVTWLESHIRSGSKRHLRVPLVLSRGDVGFSLRGARIGAAADAVEVYASDSALGIGLDDRARTHSKGGKTCTFWVEGRMVRDEDGKFRFDVIKVSSLIEPGALAAANYIEIEELAIPESGQPEAGFPIPRGARRNESLGGATSLAPGRNYAVKVYDSDLDTGTITAFYEHHLPEAERSSEEHAVVFSTPRGKVKVTRFSKGSRITLTIGPQ